MVLENITTEFHDDWNNLKQHNQIIEPTFQFHLPNGQSISFKTGFNTFKQPNLATITNIPLQIGWQSKIAQYTLKAAGGVDIFNRLPPALNLNIQVDRPIFIHLTPKNKLKSALFVSALIEEGPYKASAKSLERQIISWRSGLNVYWQIRPHTSFFSLYRIGFYNDGNFEQQSFSRLEHKIGQFYVAANLFTWRYNKDRQEISGYFSPKNFLVYNAEIGWEGNIFKFLRCKFNTTLGQQKLNNQITIGNNYQTSCTAKISPNISLDIGYAFGNVSNLSSGQNPYNNRSLTGQLQVKF